MNFQNGKKKLPKAITVPLFVQSFNVLIVMDTIKAGRANCWLSYIIILKTWQIINKKLHILS